MSWSQEKYLKALGFSAFAHRAQVVPGKLYNYVVHLASVGMEIMAVIPEMKHIDADHAVQCALLHDVLEDTTVTAEELESEFGQAVRKGVAALTKSKKLGRVEAMQDSLERILEEPPEVGMVKMADRITNLQEPPGDWLEDKILFYFEESKLIHRQLKHLSQPLADRLQWKIEQYVRFMDERQAGRTVQIDRPPE
jgi:(p)ppGpp synthase/HD superfamily hydrolase